MTPDLDQTLSMKAQLNDTVSPQLQKIERFAQTTRDELNKLVEALKAGEGTMGSSASKMADEVQQSTGKLKEEMGGVASSFRETSTTAEESSTKIGKSIQDAMYTQGAETRITDLEKDLGKLNRTMSGMASSQRAVSGKARSISAIASDNLNKKIIPAFQELHGTLDDYPDTLEKINKLEQDRMDYVDGAMGEGGGVLKGVKDRVTGIDGTLQKLNVTLQDLAGAATGTVFGAAGMSSQERQIAAAQIAGAESFDTSTYAIEAASDMANTSMDNIAPIVGTLLQLQTVSEDAMGPLVGHLYDMEKAGLGAGDSIAILYDKMQRLGGVKGEEFTLLADKVKWFAESSVLDTGEMMQVLEGAAEGMTRFSGAAAEAYREGSLAAAAAAANMGLDAGTGEGMMTRLMDDMGAMAQTQSLVNAAGLGVNVQELVSGGKIDELQDAIFQALKDQYEGVDLTNPITRQMYNAQTGGILPVDDFIKMMNSKGTTGKGGGSTSAVEMGQEAEFKAPGSVAETVEKVRGTMAETTEKWKGGFDRLLQRPGRKLMETVANVSDWGAGWVNKGADKAIEWDNAHDEIGSDITAVAAGLGAAHGTANILGAGMEGAGIPGAAIMAGEGFLGKTAHLAGGVALASSILSPNEGNISDHIDMLAGNEEQISKLQDLVDEAGFGTNVTKLVEEGRISELHDLAYASLQKIQTDGALQGMDLTNPAMHAQLQDMLANVNIPEEEDTRSPFQKTIDASMMSANLINPMWHAKKASETVADFAPTSMRMTEKGVGAAAKTMAFMDEWTNPVSLSKKAWDNEWTNPVSLTKKFFGVDQDRSLKDSLNIQDDSLNIQAALTQTEKDFAEKFDGAEFDPMNLDHQKAMNEMMQENLPESELGRMSKKGTLIPEIQEVLNEVRTASQAQLEKDPNVAKQVDIQLQMAEYLKQLVETANRPASPTKVLMTPNTAGVEAEKTFYTGARR